MFTIGNLGSQWAFVIMLLGFTHFFREEIQKRIKIFGLQNFDQETQRHKSCMMNRQIRVKNYW